MTFLLPHLSLECPDPAVRKRFAFAFHSTLDRIPARSRNTLVAFLRRKPGSVHITRWIPPTRDGEVVLGKCVGYSDRVELVFLREVVADGETGLLVGVGEKAQVAARTHNLLTEPAAAARLGASGKARAAERFPADRMAAPYARVYHELPRR